MPSLEKCLPENESNTEENKTENKNVEKLQSSVPNSVALPDFPVSVAIKHLGFELELGLYPLQPKNPDNFSFPLLNP